MHIKSTNAHTGRTWAGQPHESSTALHGTTCFGQLLGVLGCCGSQGSMPRPSVAMPARQKNRWCGLRAPGRYPPRICNEMWLGTSLWLWRIWQAAETAGSEWQGISQPQGFHSKHERGVWQFAAQVLQSQVCLHQVGEEIPPDAVQVPDCWERLQARALCHNHHDLVDPHEKAQRWANI